MYRLLIVDDEEIIVNGLYEIFSSMKQLDLDVYKAYSGEEAIEWLGRTRMDIVLTDIRMPEIDGMQLLEEIHKRWPQCKVIFLSGYNEFEYVYNAIQHTGVSYILKTEDHDKVIGAVEDAIKEIKKGIKTEDLIQTAKEQMNRAFELFQKDYFIRLLRGHSSFNIDKDRFEQLNVSISGEQPVILAIGHVDNLQQEESYWETTQYLYSIKLIISQHINIYIRYVCVLDEEYRFVFLIQPKELSDPLWTKEELKACYDRTLSFLKGTLESVQSICAEKMNASVSFVISGTPCEWEELSQKYYSLCRLLNYKVGSDIEMLLIDSDFEDGILKADKDDDIHAVDSIRLEALIRQRIPDALETYLESGQKDKYFQTLSKLLDSLRSIKSNSNAIAIEVYYKISLILLSYINRWKLMNKVIPNVEIKKLMSIDKFETWDAAASYIYNLSEVIFMLQSDEPKNRALDAIQYVQSFIEQHLSEDLSLVRLAEQVHLNPSYLSRLYKQMTGSNLSEFIETSRIAKAKELLGKNCTKIGEVARQVGYETSASFTRFFKKMVACSPQEYQERHQFVNK